MTTITEVSRYRVINHCGSPLIVGNVYELREMRGGSTLLWDDDKVNYWFFGSESVELVTDAPEPQAYRPGDYVIVTGCPFGMGNDHSELIGRLGRVTPTRNANPEVTAADGGTPFNPYRSTGGWHYAADAIRPATIAEIAAGNASTQENTMQTNAALDIPSYLIKLDQVVAQHPAVGLTGTDTVTLDFLYERYEACREGRDGVITDFRRHLNITLDDTTPFDILSGIRSMSDSSASWMLAAHRSWRTRALQLAALDALSVVCLAYPPAEPEVVRAFITEGYAVITASTDADFVHADDAHRAADAHYHRNSGLDERIGSAATAIFHAHTRLLGPENLARYLAGKSGRSLSVTTPIMREIIAQALEKRLSASGVAVAAPVADVTTPIRFEDDARVRVMRSTYSESYGCLNAGNRRMIGTIGIVSGTRIDGAYRVYLEDRSDWFMFNPSDLELVVEEVAAEPTLPAFQTGDAVRVLRSSYAGIYGRSSDGNQMMIGTVGKIRGDRDNCWAVNNANGDDFFYFNTEDLELVTEEVAAELTLSLGDRVRIRASTFGSAPDPAHWVGNEGFIWVVVNDHSQGHYRVENLDRTYWYPYMPSDLELVTMEMVLEDVTTPEIITFEGSQFTKTVQADGKVVLTPYIAPPARIPQQGEVWTDMESSDPDRHMLIRTNGGFDTYWISSTGYVWGVDIRDDIVFVADSVSAAARAGLL